MTTGSQVLGVNGLLLPNAQTATSGALPSALTTTQGEVDATSGGSAITGATGQNMPECMAAWDASTHITKIRWRQICARTLVEPHI
jgi:hypothetical protein